MWQLGTCPFGVASKSRLELIQGLLNLGGKRRSGRHFAPFQGFDLGPAGLPRPIVDRINTDAGKALGDPALVSKLPSVSIIPPSPNGPEEFANVIRADYEAMREAAKVAGITPT